MRTTRIVLLLLISMSLLLKDGKSTDSGSDKTEIVEACKTKYFISKVEQTFEKAGIACCKKGMTLATLETKSELDCVVQKLKDLKVAGTYWTAGSDFGCDGKFVWCDGTGEKFTKDAPWIPGEPTSDDNEDEDCVSLKIPKQAKKKPGLDDEKCEKKLKYLCEG